MEIIPKSYEEAPTRIKIVSGMMFAYGLFILVLSVVATILRTPIFKELALALAIEGIIDIAIAFGLIKGEKFAWVAAIAISVFQVVVLISQHKILPAILPAAILFALITSSSYYGIHLFGKPESTSTTPSANIYIHPGRYFRKI